MKNFLGIEVAHSTQGIFISQHKYVIHHFEESGKLAWKPTDKPIDPNHKLGEASGDGVIEKEMNQRLVGRLIYLSHTMPDIAYVVSVIIKFMSVTIKFMHNPKEVHLQAKG